MRANKATIEPGKKTATQNRLSAALPPASEESPNPDWRTIGIIICLLLAVTFGVFQQVRTQDFVNLDDNINIYANAHLNPATKDSIPYFWGHWFEHTYRPMVYTVWTMLAAIAYTGPHDSGVGIGAVLLNPHVFHIANLVLHGVNVVLVFVVLRLLIRKDWPACAGALLWGIHPMQVGSVAWITGMNEVLFGFFSLLALWSYLTYAIAARDKTDPKQRRLLYGIAVLFYVLALTTKPTAVILPLVAWILDVGVIRRPIRNSTLDLAGWLVLALIWVQVTRLAKPEELTQVHTALWVRPFVAGDALAFYLTKLVAPVGLCPDYGRPPDWVMGHTWGYLTWIAPAALAGLLWAMRKRCPMLGVAGGLFVAGLLPVLGIIPNSFQLFSTVADRYLYLPMLGPAFALSWALAQRDSLVNRGHALAGGSAVCLAILAALSVGDISHWQNPTTFNTHTLAVSPRSWMAANNLGIVLFAQGKTDDAIAAYQQALKINPTYATTQMNLGIALAKQGKSAEAIAAYQAALKSDPNLADAKHNLAVELGKTGKSDEAEQTYRDAMAINPNSPDSHHNLGVLLSKQGKFEEAIAEYREAVRLKPDFSEAWSNLGKTLQALGKHDAAVSAFQEVLRLDPNSERAHNSLGLSLARLGKLDDAIAQWRESARLKPDYVEALCNLGIALSMQHKTDEAAAQFREALKYNPNYKPAVDGLAKLGGAPPARAGDAGNVRKPSARQIVRVMATTVNLPLFMINLPRNRIV